MGKSSFQPIFCVGRIFLDTEKTEIHPFELCIVVLKWTKSAMKNMCMSCCMITSKPLQRLKSTLLKRNSSHFENFV